MFRASSAHLQEDTVVYMQPMVLSLSMRVRGGLSVRYTAWVRTDYRRKVVGGCLKTPTNSLSLQSVLTQAVYRQATTNSCREWQYHMLHVYKCILLKMSTSGSKHVEENNILWINNNQYIMLVINTQYSYSYRYIQQFHILSITATACLTSLTVF